jgi:beta-lactamase class A
MKYAFALSINILIIVACCFAAEGKEKPMDQLKATLLKKTSEIEGTFAISFRDLNTGDTLFINERESFHAASTMKTPVMIEIFRIIKEGRLHLEDKVAVKNEFKSIVDSSVYSLDFKDDSDTALYGFIGATVPVLELIQRMVTLSSNLATNLLMEIVGAPNVTATMHSLGAHGIQVLRGVEDGKAYRAGLNNTATARDLMIIYEALAKKTVVDEGSCDQMLSILFDQRHNDKFPALLPKEVKVAHKTGSITGIEHDSGIVYLPNGKLYVLVVLSKGLKSNEEGNRVISELSKIVYDFVTAD